MSSGRTPPASPDKDASPVQPDPDTRGAERERRALLTSITYAMARGLQLILPIVTIKILIENMGVEIYGLWMTAVSFFVMFSFADLGLGFGLLTRLSNASGRNDKDECDRLISTTFLMLTIIASILLICVGAIFPFLSWSTIFNAATEQGARSVPWIVWSVVIANTLQIPFSVVQRVQLAFQSGYKSTYWQSAGVGTSLVAIILLGNAKVSPVLLICVVTFILPLFMILNWVHYFIFTSPQFFPAYMKFNKKIALNLLLSGGAFFILNIFTSLGLSIDNLLVSRICGIGEVASFSVASRMASFLGSILVMISVPMWAANGEALARGEHGWVRQQCLKNVKIAGFLAVAGTVALIVLGPWVFTHVVGKELHVSRSLLGLCGLREALFAVASPFFMILNGAGMVKPQIKAFALFTPLVILLKIFLTRYMGSDGLVLAMALLYGFGILPWVIRTAMKICLPKATA